MASDLRYSLTRICLRTGQLSLSPRLAEIFPDSGSITAFDALSDREFELTTVAPMRVGGVAEFLATHRLQVNDQIQLLPLPDGRIALTPLPRARSGGRRDAAAVAALLDDLLAGKPRTEAEIRALHADLPPGFPLAETLRDDPRFRLQAGRWGAVDREGMAAEESMADSAPADPARADPARADSARADSAPADAAPADPASAGPASSASVPGVDRDERPAEGKGSPERERPAERKRERREEREEHPPQRERRATVTPYPRGVLFPGEAALNSKRPDMNLELVNRARAALSKFGYRVAGKPHGMLLARAELGRRQQSVLVRVLGEGERLDWAALLAARRDQGVVHLAVFGDHRDLHRLTAPAELARATLWSWDGIARVVQLARSMPIGPFDLEPHFEKGGMFGAGLERFERTIGSMIAERGVLSAVLTRLAALRAPAVFMLEDLVEAELSRDQVAHALGLLAQAPFHLVARIDKGEYCLRHRVDDSMQRVSEYALSLKDRLPRDRGERLSGSAEPADEASGQEESTNPGRREDATA
jgi:hypothetical protein